MTLTISWCKAMSSKSMPFLLASVWHYVKDLLENETGWLGAQKDPDNLRPIWKLIFCAYFWHKFHVENSKHNYYSRGFGGWSTKYTLELYSVGQVRYSPLTFHLRSKWTTYNFLVVTLDTMASSTYWSMEKVNGKKVGQPTNITSLFVKSYVRTCNYFNEQFIQTNKLKNRTSL